MINDPISDMLTRLRNALGAKHHHVRVPHTKTNAVIAAMLVRQGYVHDFRVATVSRAKTARRLKSKTNRAVELDLRLKYIGRFQRPAIVGLRRISVPSLRVYARASGLHRVFNGMGTMIVSTSRGLMTDRDARRERLGGEIIITVW